MLMYQMFYKALYGVKDMYLTEVFVCQLGTLFFKQLKDSAERNKTQVTTGKVRATKPFHSQISIKEL